MRSNYREQYDVCVEVVTDARKEAGLTQQDLAEDLGKPQSFVAKYENRQRRLDVAEFLMIMRVIGVAPLDAINAILEKDQTLRIRHRSRRRALRRRTQRRYL